MTKPRRWERIFQQWQEKTQREYEQAGEAGRFASFPNVSAAVMWRDVMRCCVHPQSGRHVQRLHNPGFPWHTTPPALHLSGSMLSTAKWSRHRWSAGIRTWTSSLCQAGWGGCQRGKSEPMGTWCREWINWDKYRWIDRYTYTDRQIVQSTEHPTWCFGAVWPVIAR